MRRKITEYQLSTPWSETRTRCSLQSAMLSHIEESKLPHWGRPSHRLRSPPVRPLPHESSNVGVVCGTRDGRRIGVRQHVRGWDLPVESKYEHTTTSLLLADTCPANQKNSKEKPAWPQTIMVQHEFDLIVFHGFQVGKET